MSEVEVAILLEWLNSDEAQMLPSPPRAAVIDPETSAKRNRNTPTKEWPPPFRKKQKSAAECYYGCTAIIYGADAPGMPRPVHHDVPAWDDAHSARLRKALIEFVCPTLADWTKVSMAVGRPVGECKRQSELLDGARARSTIPGYFGCKRRKTRVIRPVSFPHSVLDPSTCMEEIDAAAALFEVDSWWNNAGDTSPSTVIDGEVDMLCYENAGRACYDKKWVHWTGLPANPPEWKTGPRKAVTRTWEACRYVDTSSVAVGPENVFHPVLSTDMCTHSLPPPSFWT